MSNFRYVRFQPEAVPVQALGIVAKLSHLSLTSILERYSSSFLLHRLPQVAFITRAVFLSFTLFNSSDDHDYMAT